MTVDENPRKSRKIQGVDVLNIHGARRRVETLVVGAVGERIRITALVRRVGKEDHQAVG
jgi:uncharacterized protein YacL